MPLQLLRVASASQSLVEGSTPERHCAAEDGRVEASTTLESQCSHLHTERCTVSLGFYLRGGEQGRSFPPPPPPPPPNSPAPPQTISEKVSSISFGGPECTRINPRKWKY